MGIYDSVYFKCPHCGETQEDQFKPGNMNSYNFPEDAEHIPLDYIKFFSEADWTCYQCEKEFKTFVDLQITVSNARIVKEPKS